MPAVISVRYKARNMIRNWVTLFKICRHAYVWACESVMPYFSLGLPSSVSSHTPLLFCFLKSIFEWNSELKHLFAKGDNCWKEIIVEFLESKAKEQRDWKVADWQSVCVCEALFEKRKCCTFTAERSRCSLAVGQGVHWMQKSIQEQA